MSEECGNCKFFRGNDEGECRRNPPIIVEKLLKDGPSETLLDNVYWATCFPESWAGDWCGEYKPRLGHE